LGGVFAKKAASIRLKASNSGIRKKGTLYVKEEQGQYNGEEDEETIMAEVLKVGV